MRPLGIWFLMGTCAFAGSAQGQTMLGTVNINNNFIPLGATMRAYAGVLPGIPLAKAAGRVEVLDRAGTVISSVRDGTGNPFVRDGLFFLGTMEIPGTVPGGSASIMIRVWDSNSGATYATAWQRASCVVILTGLGGGAIPPPSLGNCSDFVGLFPLSWVSPPDISIETTRDGQWRIFTLGPIYSGFVLHTSPDLVDWSRGEFGRVAEGVMEWTLPNEGKAIFFRISQ